MKKDIGLYGGLFEIHMYTLTHHLHLYLFTFSCLPFVGRFTIVVALLCSHRTCKIYYGFIISALLMLRTVVNVKGGNSGNSSCPSRGLKSQLGKFTDLGTVLLINGKPQGTGKWQTRDSSRAGPLRTLLLKNKMGCSQHRCREMDCPFSLGFYKMYHSVMCHICIVSQK